MAVAGDSGPQAHPAAARRSYLRWKGACVERAEVQLAVAPQEALSDEEVVERVRDGEGALFEILMRRHNQRLYRTARSIVKDEAEAEDVMQQAYR